MIAGMEKLCISGRSLEYALAIFDMTGTLIATEPRMCARAEARARILGRLAGEEAVENWARLSGVNLETWDIDEDGPLARAPRREDLTVGSTAYLSHMAPMGGGEEACEERLRRGR